MPLVDPAQRLANAQSVTWSTQIMLGHGEEGLDEHGLSSVYIQWPSSIRAESLRPMVASNLITVGMVRECCTFSQHSRARTGPISPPPLDVQKGPCVREQQRSASYGTYIAHTTAATVHERTRQPSLSLPISKMRAKVSRAWAACQGGCVEVGSSLGAPA